MRLNIWLKPKPGSALQQAWWLHKLRVSLAQRRPRQKQIPIHLVAGERRWKGTPYHPPDPSQQPHAHPGWKVPFAAWYPRTRRGPPGQRLCDTPAGLHVAGHSPRSPPGSQHGWVGSSCRGGGSDALAGPEVSGGSPSPAPAAPPGGGSPVCHRHPPAGPGRDIRGPTVPLSGQRCQGRNRRPGSAGTRCHPPPGAGTASHPAAGRSPGGVGNGSWVPREGTRTHPQGWECWVDPRATAGWPAKGIRLCLWPLGCNFM